MRNTRKYVGFAFVAAIALTMVACDQPTDDPPASVAVTGVTLDQSSLNLTVGNSATLTATVQPSNASNKNVSWSSSNISVATVSNGAVTAVATGTATITVTTADGNKTAQCAVTVNAASQNIAVTFTGLTADGSATVSTTRLTLTFDKDIADLIAADIDVNTGSTGASKGALTRTGTGVYDLAVNGITAGGSVTVTVTKSGYAISDNTKTVTVYRATEGTSTIDITFTGPTERIISVTQTVTNNLSQSGGGSVTLGIAGSFDGYEWFTGGTELATGNSVTIQADNPAFVLGYNWITAVVYTGTGASAIPWSGAFIIYVNE